MVKYKIYTDVSAEGEVFIKSSLGYGLELPWQILTMMAGTIFIHETIFMKRLLLFKQQRYIQQADTAFKHYSRYSMGSSAAGDYNNDGQMDIVLQPICCRQMKNIEESYGNGEHLDIYNQKLSGTDIGINTQELLRNNGNG